MVDVRFSTALQVMLNLACAKRDGVKTLSSAHLAACMAANPSLVRKLLASLVRAGLVTSFLGKNGGVQLGREAAAITLRDIYAAAVNDKRIVCGRVDIPQRCLVSSNMERVFAEISTDIEDAVLSRLDTRTLATLLDEIYTKEAKRARCTKE